MTSPRSEVICLKFLIAYIINKSPKMTKKFFSLSQMKQINPEKLVLSEDKLHHLTDKKIISIFSRFQMNMNIQAINFLTLRPNFAFVNRYSQRKYVDDLEIEGKGLPVSLFKDDFRIATHQEKQDSSSFSWSIFLTLFSKLLNQIKNMKIIKIGKEEVRVIYMVIATPEIPLEMKLQAESILLRNKSFTKEFALSTLSLYKTRRFSSVFYTKKLNIFLKILIESLKKKDSALKCLKIIFLFLEETLTNSSLYSIIGEINMIFSSEENLSEDKNLIFASLNSPGNSQIHFL